MTTPKAPAIDLWASVPPPEPVHTALAERMITDAFEIERLGYALRTNPTIRMTWRQRNALAEPRERLAMKLWTLAGRILGELP